MAGKGTMGPELLRHLCVQLGKNVTAGITSVIYSTICLAHGQSHSTCGLIAVEHPPDALVIVSG